MTELTQIAKSLLGAQDDPAVRYWLPTGSLLVDLCINRGLPGGKVVEFFGDSATGKTAFALSCCRQAQLQGGTAIYIDTEARLSLSLAKKYNNIDFEKGWYYVHKNKKGEPITLEDLLDALTRISDEASHLETPTVIVIDSVAALRSKDQDPEMNTKRQMGLVANRLSGWFSYGYTSIIAGSNIYPIFINQTRSALNFFSYGPPKVTTPAGKALKFYASVRLELSSMALTKKEDPTADKDKIIGRLIKVMVEKNSVGPPYRSATFPFYFYTQKDGILGMDDYLAQLNYLIARKVLPEATSSKGTKRKGYYNLGGTTLTKLQIRKKMIEDKSIRDHIRDLVITTFREEYAV